MLGKDNISRVLEVFFDDPTPTGEGFGLREISRWVKLAPKSVKTYLEILEKEKLIIRKNNRAQKYPVYYANRENEYFKILKKISLIRNIHETGLITYIQEKCSPETIILYGSCSKGEDIKTSDIDLYIKGKIKEIDLTKYEKLLDRKIHLFFEAQFDKLSEELRKNIINGIILKGYLRPQLKK